MKLDLPAALETALVQPNMSLAEVKTDGTCAKTTDNAGQRAHKELLLNNDSLR